jgi:hypothetical protein
MDTFDKFTDVYRVDARYPTEVAQGFLWYHCRATGDRAAGIPTILRYYERAAVEAPSPADIKASFEGGRSGVVAAGSMYRVRQDAEGWFRDKFEEPVFGSGLEVYKVEAAPAVAPAGPPPGGPAAPQADPPAVGRGLLQGWRRFGRWTKDHPDAAALGFIATVVALAITVWTLWG